MAAWRSQLAERQAAIIPILPTASEHFAKPESNQTLVVYGESARVISEPVIPPEVAEPSRDRASQIVKRRPTLPHRRWKRKDGSRTRPRYFSILIGIDRPTFVRVRTRTDKRASAISTFHPASASSARLLGRATCKARSRSRKSVSRFSDRSLAVNRFLDRNPCRDF